jgi:uncharacterized protein (TIGR02246 family)
MKALLCTALLLSLAACTQPPAPVVDTREADIKAIDAVEAAALKAWTAKDMDGIMAQYAADATLVVTNAPVAKGTTELRGMLTELMKDPGLSLTLVAASTDVSGNIAYRKGSYTLHVTDPKTKKPIIEQGSYLNIFKKQADGAWRVVEDFNSAGPAAQ